MLFALFILYSLTIFFMFNHIFHFFLEIKMVYILTGIFVYFCVTFVEFSTHNIRKNLASNPWPDLDATWMTTELCNPPNGSRIQLRSLTHICVTTELCGHWAMWPLSYVTTELWDHWAMYNCTICVTTEPCNTDHSTLVSPLIHVIVTTAVADTTLVLAGVGHSRQKGRKVIEGKDHFSPPFPI